VRELARTATWLVPAGDQTPPPRSPPMSCSWRSQSVNLWNGGQWKGYAVGDAVYHGARQADDKQRRTLLAHMAASYPGSLIDDYWKAWGRVHVSESWDSHLPKHGGILSESAFADVVARRLATHASTVRSENELVLHLRVGDALSFYYMKPDELVELCERLALGRASSLVSDPWTSKGLQRFRRLGKNCTAIPRDKGLREFVLRHAERNSGGSAIFSAGQIAAATCAHCSRLQARAHIAIKKVKLVAGVHGRWHGLTTPSKFSAAEQIQRMSTISCAFLVDVGRQLSAAGLHVELVSGLPDEDFLLLAQAPHLMFQEGSGFSRLAGRVRRLLHVRNSTSVEGELNAATAMLNHTCGKVTAATRKVLG